MAIAAWGKRQAQVKAGAPLRSLVRFSASSIAVPQDIAGSTCTQGDDRGADRDHKPVAATSGPRLALARSFIPFLETQAPSMARPPNLSP
jgi:hypothetical protein